MTRHTIWAIETEKWWKLLTKFFFIYYFEVVNLQSSLCTSSKNLFAWKILNIWKKIKKIKLKTIKLKDKWYRISQTMWILIERNKREIVSLSTVIFPIRSKTIAICLAYINAISQYNNISELTKIKRNIVIWMNHDRKERKSPDANNNSKIN